METSPTPAASPESKPTRQRHPAGIIVLVCWFAYSALHALYKCFDPGVVVFSNYLSDTGGVVFHAITFLVPVAIVWRILQRKNCGRMLAIYWQVLWVLIAVADYFWFFYHQAETLEAYRLLGAADNVVMTMEMVQGSLLVALIYHVVVSSLVIWYLVRRREYFS